MKVRTGWKSLIGLHLLVGGALLGAVVFAPVDARSLAREEILGEPSFRPVPIPRSQPLRAQPLYNRPDLVSDEDLAAVLQQVRPPFGHKEMKPNFVEHALRLWGVDATFANPKIVSGKEMLEFLTDHRSYVTSWGTDIEPLLGAGPDEGVAVRWGVDRCASYHHDHLLACVTEGGAPLDTPVYGPGRTNHTLYNLVQQSLRDFRLDERETEWTAMAFGLWIAPQREWIGSGGRHYSFDLLVDRLLRGEMQTGVCVGTHRVYSLMLLVRLDDEHDILTDAGRAKAWAYLESVRDRISASQLPDGHWPSNWPQGAAAVEHPIEEDLYKQVIATGHHLEWLSIAPPELHPGEAQVHKAMEWIIRTTKERSHEEILANFTFFSHVGAALSNWRQVRAADFWRKWEADHPVPAEQEFDPDAPAKASVQPQAAGH